MNANLPLEENRSTSSTVQVQLRKNLLSLEWHSVAHCKRWFHRILLGPHMEHLHVVETSTASSSVVAASFAGAALLDQADHLNHSAPVMESVLSLV